MWVHEILLVFYRFLLISYGSIQKLICFLRTTMDSNGFLWISNGSNWFPWVLMNSYVFLWAPIDSYAFLRYGALWIHMESYECLLVSIDLWLISDSNGLLFLLISDYYGFLWVPMGFLWVPSSWWISIGSNWLSWCSGILAGSYEIHKNSYALL